MLASMTNFFDVKKEYSTRLYELLSRFKDKGFEIHQQKLEELKDKEQLEERKHMEFSEKIDELNQETDSLMDEIDKWQT